MPCGSDRWVYQRGEWGSLLLDARLFDCGWHRQETCWMHAGTLPRAGTKMTTFLALEDCPYAGIGSAERACRGRQARKLDAQPHRCCRCR